MKVNLYIDTTTKEINFEVGKTDYMEEDNKSIFGSAPYDYFAKLDFNTIINELIKDYENE